MVYLVLIIFFVVDNTSWKTFSSDFGLLLIVFCWTIQSYPFFFKFRSHKVSPFLLISLPILIYICLIFAEEGPEFNNEWQNKTRQYMSPNAHHSIQYHQSIPDDEPKEQLALPPIPRYGIVCKKVRNSSSD